MKTRNAITRAKYYITLLRGKYLEEVLVIPSTIAVMLIDMANRPSVNGLDLIAILFPVLYLIYVFFDIYNTTLSLTDNLQSGYSLCLGKSRDEYIDMIRKQRNTLHNNKVDLSTVFAHFRVIDSDWQYHEGGLTNPTKWKESVAQVNEHFLRYAQRVPIDTKLHLFLQAPCPVAIGLGFCIGKHRPWTVYQYDSSLAEYKSIYQSDNQVPPITIPYKFINVDSKGGSSNDVTVIVSFVAKAPIPLPSINGQTIEISPRSSKLKPEDFSSVAVEIIDCLNTLLREGKTLHLFPGLPISLGFVIGREFDEQANVLVYNVNNKLGKWECVLKMQDLLI